MRVITSSGGEKESVTIRRSESADAQGIESLVGPSARAVFGRINVLHLLEKANLAVTLADEKDDIVAHAAFLDHPVGGLVDQTEWETFLQRHFGADQCSPLNTLFLHLFVARPDFATSSLNEIIRTVFTAVPELEYICLVKPNTGDLDSTLDETFQLLQPLTTASPQCSAFICHRQQHCPRLRIRAASVEDHDDIMGLFTEQMKRHLAQLVDRPYFLTDLIEARNEENHLAVCESDGVIVGFISVTCDVNVNQLQEFELSLFGGLTHEEAAWGEEEEEGRIQTSDLQQQEKKKVFCVQFFVMDKNHELRSADFIPYVFQLFPEKELCVITVPTASAEFQLLQSFIRVPRQETCSLFRELYMFHRSGLSSVEVKPAAAADRPAVSHLVRGLRLSENLLQDLDYYYKARRDPEGVRLHAFVAHMDGQVVGMVIMRDEQDLEYLRAHYNIENFIYFSHHRYDEHARMSHFVLRPPCQHFTKHLFKEVLRLSRKSCMYHRKYPPESSQENSCIHHLDFVLNCAVPVRPRRQIIYPLEELGTNVPSRQITEAKAPFALRLISRKLTMEPKVTVNARIVVVGASDTGLSFLEVLSFCPHLKFNSLTLVSTHGYRSDCSREDVGFLTTSHAYSSRDLAQLPLHSCITVMTGKMVGINRKSKYIRVSGGRKLPYDYLVLCTGLQYQVPCPTGVDLSQPITTSQLQDHALRRYSGPVPSNLFTLNDPDDCVAARHWLCDKFLELQENAVVYGNGVNVFTTVETLLSMGVQGRRINLILTPPEPGVSCFSDLEVEKGVAAAMEKAEVQVHRNCLLAQMTLSDEHPDRLTSVSFTTDGEPLHLQCGVFINFSNKGIDYDAFKSIVDSFLVFDSRLVINATYCTSDAAIFGAGPLTKFSLCYHAANWSHTSFNSREVGQHLAAMLLLLFDPTQEPEDEASPEVDRLIPPYKAAKIEGGKLPGGLHYLHVANPTGPAVKRDGDIVTGRAETGNYFHLRLDCHELVETLTCLSVKPLPVSNYLCLYRKHQQLLGNLVTSYQQGLIHDLYSFFRQSWCLAIYHDRFSDFEQELQQLTSTTDNRIDAVNLVALRSSAVTYLTYNRNLLPMFAPPGQL